MPYRIKESELSFEFMRSAGPGGQNVNKVSTAARLRFNIRRSASIPEQIKTRLLQLAGNRVDKNGTLIIRAQRFRTQEANRRDALKRLEQLVAEASKIPRKRKISRPALSVTQGRLEKKRLRGEIKMSRKRVDQDADA